jgi:hypothetical protein
MKISDKLKKVNDTISVNICDNGFMVEVSGRDHEDDYNQVKIVCLDLNTVSEIIQEAVEMEST